MISYAHMAHNPEDELRVLIAHYFDGDLTAAAAAISRARGRPASVRTLQAWLAVPSHPSKRTCPLEAVDALKRAVVDPAFVALRRAPARARGGAVPSSRRVRARDWNAIPLGKLENELNGFEQNVLDRQSLVESLLQVIFAAAIESRTYEEFRLAVVELRQNLADSRWQTLQQETAER